MTIKYLTVAVRILFGALFAFSGFTKLFGLGSQSMDGMPAEAVAFATALGESGFIMPITAVVELVAGVMLLVNRFAPLALALLAPLVVGIFGFHVLLAPSGAAVAVVLAVAELYLAWAYRESFKPMLMPRHSQPVPLPSLSKS
ncbi:DoxX family membrane protein [Lentzea alba]|uniref:DoxX family membrane protein n=1 Tax=Lentzea alba TaxID=2714351 RepID=UPI0039BFFD58